MKQDTDFITKANEEERNKKAHKYKENYQKDYQRIQKSIQKFNAKIREREDKSRKYKIILEAYKIGNYKDKDKYNF